MKKRIMILIIAAFIFVSAGCNNNVAVVPDEPIVLPTEVIPPDVVDVERLLEYVSELIEFEEGWELEAEFAEIWDDPDQNENLYVFFYGSFDIVLFADMDTNAFKYGYLRLLSLDENTLMEVTTLTGAFLRILEPNRYMEMLEEVLHIEDYEHLYTEEEHMPLDLPEVAYTSHGEAWTLIFSEGRLFNIIAKLDDSAAAE